MANKTKYNVQPIRTIAEIEEIKRDLKRIGDMNGRNSGDRDRFLFTFGINTGLRISDIVSLKVKDVLNKVYIELIEQKTQKKRMLDLIGISEEINAYCKGKSLDDYLFPSRKGSSHISTTQAYRILTNELLGREDLGTHSMRKTYGYHVYKATFDILGLMEDFGHATQGITKKYIGITEEERRISRKGFKL
ncbi:tyrosine-type recombinase/integrase [Planococcus halocryophilus]|uniref:tyrosine-type recombinase/integrase n=1 Tax=Planococcus halocryophilus TaxID=1215089 RepID=UPI001F0D6A41|nr:tyrosine-type recombinase/integrase [Planococcus halocryophilus]MCH4825770.1 tyrosine-type recombinase/integrase [Planococcus halocryophilus]